MQLQNLALSLIERYAKVFGANAFCFRNAKQQAFELKQRLDDPSATLESCFSTVIGNSINHHLLILELAKELESLNSEMVLSIFLASVLQLCFMLYQTSLVNIIINF